MKIMYAVPWVDIEYGWGGKSDGYKVFETIDECITESIKDSENGNYEGGYIGPERPLIYCETNDELDIKKFPAFVKSLKFKSNFKNIKT